MKYFIMKQNKEDSEIYSISALIITSVSRYFLNCYSHLVFFYKKEINIHKELYEETTKDIFWNYIETLDVRKNGLKHYYSENQLEEKIKNFKSFKSKLKRIERDERKINDNRN